MIVFAGFAFFYMRQPLKLDYLGRGSALSARPTSCSGGPAECLRQTGSSIPRKCLIPGDPGGGRQACPRDPGLLLQEEASIAEELVYERMAKGEASGYFFLFAEEAGRLLGYTCFGPIPVRLTVSTSTG